MVQTRYERLNTTSNREDDHSAEKIELSTDNHTRYQVSKQESNDPSTQFNKGPTHANAAAHVDTRNGRNARTGGSGTASHLPSSSFMHMAIGTVFTILLYLTLSICLTFYQKALIKKLKFPLTIVTYHLVIKYILAASVRTIYKCRALKSRVQLDCRTSVRKMAPTGFASGIDIGFSNWGLELVSISLYTMTKSSTIVFILFFAILLGLEKKSWLLVLIVGLIATGLFMFTYKSTEFDMLGFIFILVASLSSGIRWSFAQFLMQKSKLGLHNPVDMIYYMQPWMIVSLLPFLATFEGQKLFDILKHLPTIPNEVISMTILKISFGAIVAFFMEISEFLVLSKTSSLTLSIAGIFKDICQLVLAVELNGDQLTLLNVFGLVVCLAGICCHLVHKYSTLTNLDELNSLEDDVQFDESAATTNSSANHNVVAVTAVFKNHSSQTVPLLEPSDSEDSNNDPNDQNASDVIFDVLKRRDVSR